MRYDQYYRFFLKIKKIRDFFHYYRVLLLGIMGTVVITSSTVFSIKGIVNGEVFFDNTITYGQAYQPSGNAIFDEVIYEYAPIDSDQWSETAPIRVGQYQVRGKAKNNFNDFYYGKTHFYSIVPKLVAIEFIEQVVTYGSKPSINIPLLYQDSLVDYEISYADFSSLETTMTVDLASIKIIDLSGQDITECYTFYQEETPLTFLPKPVEFSFFGGEKIYDDTPLENPDYQRIGHLAFKDRYELTDSLSQTMVGSIVNAREVKFYNESGLDVTHLYALITKSDALIVQKRPIRVQSASVSKVYDGKPYNQEAFLQEIVSGSLLASHRLDVSFLKTNLYQVTSDLNTFSVTIYNDADEVVNDLYNIETSFGIFEITKRPITVTSNSAQKVYDGTPIKDEGYTITSGELTSSDRIESVCEVSLLNIGSVNNRCEFKIIHESNQDVTDSYLLNNIPGSLMISNRPLTIHLPRREKVYDGNVLEVKDFTFDEAQLADEHALILDEWTTAINVGTYNHRFKWRILDKDGIPVTQNYDLQVLGIENGVVINRRPLTLMTKTLDKAYNAEPLTVFTAASNADKFDVIDGDVAIGDNIRVLSSSSLTNVGTIPNIVEVVIENNQGINVTSNYDLKIETGTLSVKPFQSLTIASTNHIKTYDDQPFASTSHFTVSPSLFPGDRISNIEITSPQVNVGQASMIINPASIVIRNNRNEIITANYDLIILTNQGTLTVNPRPLNIRINSQTKTYDGLPLISNQQAIGTSLAPGHSLQISSGVNPPVSITNFQAPVLTQSIAKVFRGNVEVSSNYAIDIEEGLLTVNRRPIAIETNGGSKIYDGTPLTSFIPSANLKAGSLALVTGHQLVATFDKDGYQPTNVFDQYGEFYINSASFKIIDTLNQNQDVTFNYTIDTVTFGIVQILRRNIELSIIPLRLEYNGKFQGYNIEKSTIYPRNGFDNNPIYLTGGSLPSGFRLETGVLLQAKESGEYIGNFNLVDLAFYDANNQRVDERNFSIDKRFGLTIQKRPITISSLGGSKVEDGNPFPKTKQISMGQLAEGHTIFYPETPDLIFARPEPYIHEIYQPIIYDEFLVDVTRHYQINYQFGEVVIVK